MLDLDPELVKAVLSSDWRQVPLTIRQWSALALLEELTLRPATVATAELEALIAELGREAAAEAMYVGFLFNVQARLAAAFDFPLPSPAQSDRVARTIRRWGYRCSSLPG